MPSYHIEISGLQLILFSPHAVKVKKWWFHVTTIIARVLTAIIRHS